MSRVHDALRRAEQAGAVNLEGVTVADDHQVPERPAERAVPRVLFDEPVSGAVHPQIPEGVQPQRRHRETDGTPKRHAATSASYVSTTPDSSPHSGQSA